MKQSIYICYNYYIWMYMVLWKQYFCHWFYFYECSWLKMLMILHLSWLHLSWCAQLILSVNVHIVNDNSTLWWLVLMIVNFENYFEILLTVWIAVEVQALSCPQPLFHRTRVQNVSWQLIFVLENFNKIFWWRKVFWCGTTDINYGNAQK